MESKLAIFGGTYPADGAEGVTTAVLISVFTLPFMSTLIMLVVSEGGIPSTVPLTFVVTKPLS